MRMQKQKWGLGCFCPSKCALVHRIRRVPHVSLTLYSSLIFIHHPFLFSLCPSPLRSIKTSALALIHSYSYSYSHPISNIQRPFLWVVWVAGNWTDPSSHLLFLLRNRIHFISFHSSSSFVSFFRLFSFLSFPCLVCSGRSGLVWFCCCGFMEEIMLYAAKYVCPDDSDDALDLIEKLTMHAAQVQDQVLCNIIRQNACTEYLDRFLHGCCFDAAKEAFRKKVPLVTYEDIKPYIQRIAEGDTSNILCAEPITEFLTSSGTSGGVPKLTPTVASELDRKVFFYNLQRPIVRRYFQGLEKGKAMYLYFIKAEMRTPSGLLARPVLTSYYKSNHFKNSHKHHSACSGEAVTSPYETIVCADNTQSMYCQLLCGLLQRNEVLRVGAVFASAFLRAIQFLESHWKEMCEDIRSGHLRNFITDRACRESVSKMLKQDPELAESIEAECSQTWEGIITRLWPHTKYIEVIVTGSMAVYIPRLNHYSGGKLPLVCSMYASSECYCGINLNPLDTPADVSYTFLPNMAYFEFLPVPKHEHHHRHKDLRQMPNSNGNGFHPEGEEPVELADVKVGHYYELLVTTFAGLYRYRVGDILLVTGFHNRAPKFQFICRKNVVLSVDTDKTSEEDLHKAVTRAEKKIEEFNWALKDYTSSVDMASIPGHYVLFWELLCTCAEDEESFPVAQQMMEQCCGAVEEGLDFVYRRCRSKDKSIGPLEIRVVKTGTFDRLMDHFVGLGASVNQYKTPRYVKPATALQLLNSNVVDKFFSRKAPSWSPALDSP